jgi:hypothetical protein
MVYPVCEISLLKKQLLLFYHITEKNASFLFRNITKAAGKIPTALIL